jgi:hypothetical protein
MQVNGLGERLQDSFWHTSTDQFGVVICVIAQLATLNRVKEQSSQEFDGFTEPQR